MIREMNDTNTGGQAFPCLERGGNGLELTDGGMTLRDYFAAKAMQSPHAPYISPMTQADGNNVIDPWPCEWAYMVADAMLKARDA